MFRKKLSLIAPEQLANRRGTSAEIASAIFGILIEWEPDKPLTTVISDIKGAYDNVWRDGAWAKMADSHVAASSDPHDALIDVKRIKAQYENVKLQVVEPHYRSEIYSFQKGLPQGGPKSGDIHGGFTSDLTEDIRNS